MSRPYTPKIEIDKYVTLVDELAQLPIAEKECATSTTNSLGGMSTKVI